MPSSKSQLVMVLDDDKLVRHSLTLILEAEGFSVETFSNGRELLARELPGRPSCLILDMQMPGLSGLDVQAKLLDYRELLPIIFISAHGTVQMTAQAMKLGAVDFLTKPLNSGELLAAVRRALQKAKSGHEQHRAQNEAQTRWQTLTPREQEVFQWLITGRLNKQIAAELGTTERTIKAHRKQVFGKMGVNSVAELVWLAEKAEIAPADRSQTAS